MRPSTSTHEIHKPRVLFIREWEQQLAASGCCGRLEGDLLGSGAGGGRVFAERRCTMEALGMLYRHVQERYGDEVEHEIIDPRNLLAVVGRLFTDFRRYRVSLPDAARTVTGISTTCVIVNGRLFARGEWPDASRLMTHLDQLCRRAT